jgi:hypothetical protein
MSEDTKIKDVPVSLPDGTPVTLGMTIYTVKKNDISSYERGREVIKTWSGDVAVKLIENKVISVNQSSTARTFTVRSDRGCEQTYSVRNNCLPDLFGKKSAALDKMKEFHNQDIEKIQVKLQRLEQHYAETKNKYVTTIKKLKAAKIS